MGVLNLKFRAIWSRVGGFTRREDGVQCPRAEYPWHKDSRIPGIRISLAGEVPCPPGPGWDIPEHPRVLSGTPFRGIPLSLDFMKPLSREIHEATK